MTKKISIVTLGCPKNQVDSEVMSGLLGENYVITDRHDEAEVIIVNTCTFIGEAKEESIETILDMARYKTSGQCRALLAAGCLAQRYGPELMQELPELDGVLGTGNIVDIGELVEKAAAGRTIQLGHGRPDFIFDERLPRRRSTPRHYAYVKIAEGCDNCCTFCVIPQVRGRFRSRSEESILAEVEILVADGVKEILLIAQDTTRYGVDRYGEQRLPQLIRMLAGVAGLEWIRLMYCYPDLVTDELIETMRTEPKVCRYLDLPVQHADDQILAAMNRRGTAAQAADLVRRLRQAMPDITVRTTMITGFPGETEAQFARLLEFVEEVQFDRLGAFAYSQEENTAAGRRPDQIPLALRQERRDRLMAKQQEIALRRQQGWIGRNVKVVLEEALPDGRWSGRTEGDAPEIDGQVYVDAGDRTFEAGDFVRVLIKEADSYDLLGEVVA